MVAQQALATGTLGATPIANLLVYALDRRLTGTLVIEDPRHQKCAIGFRRGSPVKVKLGEPVAPLATVLVGLRALDEETCSTTLATARAEGRLHGEVMIAGGVLDPMMLLEALAEQIAQKVEWLCKLPPESLYGYYDGQDFLQAYGGRETIPTEPLNVVWRALRLQAEPSLVDTTLSRLGGREARLHPRSRVARFGFTLRERGIIDVLRGKPQSVPSLVATGLLPERDLKTVLYALVVTRHLDLGGGALPIGVDATSLAPPVDRAPAPPVDRAPAPPAEPARPSVAASAPAERPRQSGAPVNMSPELQALRAEIRKRSEAIGSQNYYQILGVAEDAPTATIQSAFFQLAKQWHPDRMGVDVADLRELSMRVFARMSEAHQVLTNDEKRREYERLMREGGAAPDEQEMVQKVLRAATAFQKAEVLVRRGNLEEAEKHAQIAVDNDPEQAEYVALYADVLSQKPERTQTGNYADVLRMVNDARRNQPDNLKVRLYRARVLKRSGDLDAAHREFRGIVEQDAHNVEAAREVRLHEMRHGKRNSDPKKITPSDGRTTSPKQTGKGKQGAGEAGLFGKLFKR